ncbi:MAG: 3-dehydroquinate dehydratase [Clostridia bacterium]|nr:3-dehydroquinate dehydratase [Clostridia bacterium]
MRIMVINGPNLNKLGSRDEKHYGSGTYEDLKNMIIDAFMLSGHTVNVFQSNSEGKIIDMIQEADNSYDGIVINPGAYSHYSYAIMDAIQDCQVKVVEVHISDVLNRDDFRKVLITGAVCDKVISGKGFDGYIEAIEYILGE